MARERNLEKDIGKRRFELFMRTPLKQELELIFRKSRLDNLSSDERNKLDNRFEELWIKTRDEWNCFLYPTWYDKKESDIANGKVAFACYLNKDERGNTTASDRAPACFVFSSGKIMIIDYEKYIKEDLIKRIQRDLNRPCQESRHFERTGWLFYYLDGGYDDRGNVYIPVPPVCIPIGIDIGGLSVKDKTRVTEEIWTLIKSKIKEKKAKAKGQRGLPAIRDSKELGFISSVSDDVFANYLKWYDLHMDQELPFRAIAFHEYLDRNQPDKAEEAKKRLAERIKIIKSRTDKERTIRGVVGESIKGEDNVEQGVKLIYQAIHRKAYPSKKRQELFNCQQHGANCPKNCLYFETWMKSFNKKTMLFKPLNTLSPEVLVQVVDDNISPKRRK